MSIYTLPPIYEKWTDEDVDRLNLAEVRDLHLQMSKNFCY
jgi:hypothetical protein